MHIPCAHATKSKQRCEHRRFENELARENRIGGELRARGLVVSPDVNTPALTNSEEMDYLYVRLVGRIIARAMIDYRYFKEIGVIVGRTVDNNAAKEFLSARIEFGQAKFGQGLTLADAHSCIHFLFGNGMDAILNLLPQETIHSEYIKRRVFEALENDQPIIEGDDENEQDASFSILPC